MYTTKSLDFPTGSSYEGAWDKSLHCMQGFGCYKYPDDSIYHGYFKHGKFHGFGSLKLADPYNFTIKGFFKNGRLVKIEKMFFEDGLHVKAEPKAGKLDFSEWSYCSKEDRRFPAEILNGLRAVGPNAMTTRNPTERHLALGDFDTEQGIYHPKSGFISSRPSPYVPSQFLACLDEINWITSHCREGHTPDKLHEPKQHVCHDTIKTNIESQHLTNLTYGEKCTLSQKPGHKYFVKLYEIELAEAKKMLHGENREKGGLKKQGSAGSLLQEKTESLSSFTVEKLKDKELEHMICERTDNICERSDKSLSLDMSFLNLKQKMFN